MLFIEFQNVYNPVCDIVVVMTTPSGPETPPIKVSSSNGLCKRSRLLDLGHLNDAVARGHCGVTGTLRARPHHTPSSPCPNEGDKPHLHVCWGCDLARET